MSLYGAASFCPLLEGAQVGRLLYFYQNIVKIVYTMLKESNFVKIRISVPVIDADKVRQACGKAGAGQQGNYVYCSGSYQSTGRFIPLEGANPAIGKIGESEEVEEEIIEMLCHKDLVETVVLAIKKVHPYEEPAIDIFPRLEINN